MHEEQTRLNSVPEKIKSTYDLCVSQNKKYVKWSRVSFFSMCATLGAMVIYAIYQNEGKPIWTQPLIAQIAGTVVFICLFFLLFSSFKMKPPYFEKKVFIKIYKAHTLLERFYRLEGSNSQASSDLESSKKLLADASKRLIGKNRSKSSYELKNQLQSKYAKVGKLVQTKILYLIEKDEKRGLIQQKILMLLETFSDPTINKFDLCIKSLSEISETGPFKDKKNFLEKNPRMRSWCIHLGKFVLCLIAVTSLSLTIAYFCSTPYAELTVVIVGATFALYASWEFKDSR